MAEGLIGIDEPSAADKNLHSWSKTVGANTVQDQVIVKGDAFSATYIASFANIATTTSSSHIVALEADGTNYIKIRRISLWQRTLAGVVNRLDTQVLRTTTASSAGSTITPAPVDTGDSAFGGVCRTLPTAGSEGTILLRRPLTLFATAPITTHGEYQYVSRDDAKPIVIQPATTNGIAIKIITGVGTATVDGEIEFVVSSYV